MASAGQLRNWPIGSCCKATGAQIAVALRQSLGLARGCGHLCLIIEEASGRGARTRSRGKSK